MSAIPFIVAGAANARSGLRIAKELYPVGKKAVEGLAQTFNEVGPLAHAVHSGMTGATNAVKDAAKALFHNPTATLTAEQRDAITHLEDVADLASSSRSPCNADISSSVESEKMIDLVDDAAKGQAARMKPMNDAAQKVADSVGHLRVTPSAIVLKAEAPISVASGLEEAAGKVYEDSEIHPGATSGMGEIGKDRPTVTADRLVANIDDVMRKGNPTRRLRSFPAAQRIDDADYSVSAIAVAPGMTANPSGIDVVPQGGHNIADQANRDGYAVRLSQAVPELPENNFIALYDSTDDPVEPDPTVGAILDVSTPLESPHGYLTKIAMLYGHSASVAPAVSGALYHLAIFTAQGYTSGSGYTWLDPATGEPTDHPYLVQIASVPLQTHEGHGAQEDYGVIHLPIIPNYPGQSTRNVTCFVARVVDNTTNAIISSHTLHFTFSSLLKIPFGSLITKAMDENRLLYHLDELSNELKLVRSPLLPSSSMLDCFGRAHRRADEDPNFSAPGIWRFLLTENVAFNTWLRETVAAWELDRTTGPGIRDQLVEAGVVEVYVDTFINEPADWVYEDGGWPKSADKKRAILRVLEDIMHPLAGLAAHGNADKLDRMLHTAGDDIV